MLVHIRTADGRFLSGGPQPESPLYVVDDPPDWFDWDESNTTLSSLASGGAIPFRVIRPAGNGVVLQHAGDGTYLSVQPGEGETGTTADVDAAGRLTLEPVTPREDGSHGCCGPRFTHERSDVGPAWEDFSHKEALRSGAGILKAELSGEAKEFQSHWSKPAFKKGVEDGLHDADNEVPWNGSLYWGFRAFENHFFDPDSGHNFFDNGWTAFCDCRRYFNLSVHAGRRMMKLGSDAPEALVRRTGHFLGLSLHFLTDVTQPMHAANFANYFGAAEDRNRATDDRRHEGFEEAGDAWVKDRYDPYYQANPLTREDVRVDNIVDPGTLLRTTARDHKEIYRNWVARPAAAKKKPANRGWGHDYTKKWGAEANPAFERSLLFTPKVIARYLAFWASRVSRAPEVVHTQWYQILSRSHAPVQRQHGEFMMGRVGETGHDSQFCFVFNADGTWTVVCRGALAKVWHMSTPVGSAWVVESSYDPGVPEPYSRFRFVPFGAGGSFESTFWIFEPTKYPDGDPEVVALDDRTGPKLRRWIPDDDATQVFRLRAVETVNPTDYKAVKANWPDYGEHEWWGSK